MRVGLLLTLVASALAAMVAFAPTANGWTGVDHEVGGYDVSVTIPFGWFGFDVPLSPTDAKQLRRVSPQTAAVVSGPMAKMFGFRVVAISEHPESTPHFSANLNVIIRKLPPGTSLRTWMFSGSSAALQYVVKLRPVTAGKEKGLHFVTTRIQKYGTIPLLTDTYAYSWGGLVFLFTYTSLGSDKSRYLPIFTASAESIRFGPQTGRLQHA